MDKAEKLWIASKYAAKGYGYEQLKWGDDLYDHNSDPDFEELVDEIFEYMVEREEIGSIAFAEKYKEFKLY